MHMLNRCIKLLWPTLKVAIMKEVVKVARVQLKAQGIWTKVRAGEEGASGICQGSFTEMFAS